MSGLAQGRVGGVFWRVDLELKLGLELGGFEIGEMFRGGGWRGMCHIPGFSAYKRHLLVYCYQ